MKIASLILMLSLVSPAYANLFDPCASRFAAPSGKVHHGAIRSAAQGAKATPRIAKRGAKGTLHGTKVTGQYFRVDQAAVGTAHGVRWAGRTVWRAIW